MKEQGFEFTGTNDVVFKKIFTNPVSVASMMSALLGQTILPTEITMSPTEIRQGVDLKTSRLDVRFKMLESQNDVDMEMQEERPNYDIRQRMLYYMGQMITESEPRGRSYLEKKIYCIWFLNFRLFADERCIHEFAFQDREEILGEVKVITIEFTKKGKCDKIGVKKWIEILEGEKIEEVDEGMKEAMEKMEEINTDEELKEILRIRKKTEEEQRINYNAAYANGEEAGLQEGLEQGLEQGLKQGNLNRQNEIIRNMKKNHFTMKEMILATGLTEEEIEKIIKEE